MEKKISIVVPVYNAEKTLDRCVQSLLSQVYSHIEILLVNDGSRDGSLEICRRYAREDASFRIWVQRLLVRLVMRSIMVAPPASRS